MLFLLSTSLPAVLSTVMDSFPGHDSKQASHTKPTIEEIKRWDDERKANPGQYFVLKFDFSEIDPSPDLTEAYEILTKFLNSSLETFYRTYSFLS
jgi:hypothetical protein